jgi:hypothetical protein
VGDEPAGSAEACTACADNHGVVEMVVHDFSADDRGRKESGASEFAEHQKELRGSAKEKKRGWGLVGFDKFDWTLLKRSDPLPLPAHISR